MTLSTSQISLLNILDQSYYHTTSSINLLSIKYPIVCTALLRQPISRLSTTNGMALRSCTKYFTVFPPVFTIFAVCICQWAPQLLGSLDRSCVLLYTGSHNALCHDALCFALCRDKAHLSATVGNYSEKLYKDFEDLDRISIQADMWKSKFLASR